MNKSRLVPWMGLILTILGLTCAPTKTTKKNARDLTVTILTTDDWIKRGIEVDAGNFSLRFGYNVGKAYAEDTTKLSPDDTRHNFHKLSAWIGYYIEKGEFGKAEENLKNLDKQFAKYIQNQKIQIARMTLYNIFSEFYLNQYEKTKDKSFLDSADAYVQRVFNEN